MNVLILLVIIVGRVDDCRMSGTDIDAAVVALHMPLLVTGIIVDSRIAMMFAVRRIWKHKS